MSISVLVDAMVANGCSAEQIAGVVRAQEAKTAADGEARRAAKRRDVSEKEWWSVRAAVFARDGFKCVYCGSDGEGFSLHADHVIPKSRGGFSTLENLVASCRTCNCSKCDRTPDEWRN